MWARRRLAGPLLAICACSLLLVLGGCGEKQEAVRVASPQPLDLELDYPPNADHVGIYAAQANGHFAQQGLDVHVRPPANPQAPIRDVAAGTTDVAVAYEPDVLRARAAGLPVVSIGALVQRPLASVISLPAARIHRPQDLAGKRVGTAGVDYQSAYLHTMLVQSQANPPTAHEVNVGSDLLGALLTHRVDAILGAYWNYEAVELRLRGENPQVIPVDAAGVPPYNGLVLIANQGEIAKNGDHLRRFIAALGRGTRDVEQNPQASLTGLLKAAPGLDPRLQLESVKATLPAFAPPAGKPYAYQDLAQWQAFSQWMQQNSLLSAPVRSDTALTNSLLPGQGL